MALLPSRRTENPLTAFRGMLDEFFSEPFFRMGDRDLAGTMWPRLDINEEKNQYIIRADLPGVSKEDINVSIDGDVLTISGEKKQERREGEGEYSHLERTYGSFSRSFSLPEYVDKESVDANYKNGVLELRLNKTGEPKRKAKQIEIKS